MRVSFQTAGKQRPSVKKEIALDWAESGPRNSGRVGKAVWPAIWIKSRFIGTSHLRSRRWYFNGWSRKVEVPNFEKLVLFVSAVYLSRSQSLYWRIWFRLLMSVRFCGARKMGRRVWGWQHEICYGLVFGRCLIRFKAGSLTVLAEDCCGFPLCL
jgi:hypothetical protein